MKTTNSIAPSHTAIHKILAQIDSSEPRDTAAFAEHPTHRPERQGKHDEAAELPVHTAGILQSSLQMGNHKCRKLRMQNISH